ncbi:hypothetical protein C8R46DRAFT_1234407 [Mycena filopes]|nr:hypothetical protein C8R46DRAFT_1234407 [Mycena filopes]
MPVSTRSTTASPSARRSPRRRYLSPAAVPYSSPSSSSSRQSGRSSAVLEASHAKLYPLATKLGLVGDKKAKRRDLERRITQIVELFSPKPPPTVLLASDHQGHRLSGMRLSTGQTSGNDAHAGSWVQSCEKDCRHGCSRWNYRSFVVAGPLPPSILNLPELQDLFRVRAELRPVPRPVVTVKKPSYPRPASEAPSVSSAASDAAPADLDAFPALSPLHDPAPGPSQFTDERSPSPQTPHRSLRFDFGGYGGAHYSPEGYILHPPAFHVRGPDASGSNVDNGPAAIAAQSIAAAPSIVFDACTPVVIFLWHTNAHEPIRSHGYPRVPVGAAHSVLHIGELHLIDCKVVLEKAGLPAGAHLERYLAAGPQPRTWIDAEWDSIIPVYGRDQIIYLKTDDRYTPIPEHFIELLCPNYFD